MRAKVPSAQLYLLLHPRSLRTGVKEGTELHAPLKLRISIVGPDKKGSVTHAEYLSELLESVPEHTHSPYSHKRSPPKPLISPRRYFASAQRVGRTGRHASLRPSRPAVFPCCFLAMTATATSSRLHGWWITRALWSMCALRALRRSRRHYTPSPLIVLGYGGGSVLCGSIGQCWTGLT